MNLCIKKIKLQAKIFGFFIFALVFFLGFIFQNSGYALAMQDKSNFNFLTSVKNVFDGKNNLITRVPGNTYKVTMKNVLNGDTTLPNSKGYVYLYKCTNGTCSSKSVVGQKLTDTNGVAQFSNLATGWYYSDHEFRGGPFTGEYENWGRSTNTLYISPTQGQDISFTRYNPYGVSIKFYNSNNQEINTDTPITLGESIKAEVKVQNNNPYGTNKLVETRLLLNQNSSDYSNFNFNSSKLDYVAKNDSKIFTYYYTPTKAGIFYRSIKIKIYDNNWFLTDSWKLSGAFKVNAPSMGNLNVTINNTYGGNPNVPDSNGKVQLFNSADQQVGSDQTITHTGSGQGEAKFSDISLGGGYYAKIYQNNSEWGNEYWGKSSFIRIDSGSNSNFFTRNEPYSSELTFEDVDNNNATIDMTHPVLSGHKIKAKIKILNPQYVNISNVKAVACLGFSSSNCSEISSPISSIDARQAGTFEITFIPSSTGTYRRNIAAYHDNTLTDSWSWADAFVVNQNNDPVLSDVGFNPTSITTADDVSFIVKYTDKEGDRPNYVNINIDGGGTGRTFPMESFSNGIYRGKVGKLSEGYHSYYIETKNDYSGIVKTELANLPYVSNPSPLIILNIADKDSVTKTISGNTQANNGWISQVKILIDNIEKKVLDYHYCIVPNPNPDPTCGNPQANFNYEWIANDSEILSGNHTVTIKAYDNTNNIGSTYQLTNFAVVKDYNITGYYSNLHFNHKSLQNSYVLIVPDNQAINDANSYEKDRGVMALAVKNNGNIKQDFTIKISDGLPINSTIRFREKAIFPIFNEWHENQFSFSLDRFQEKEIEIYLTIPASYPINSSIPLAISLTNNVKEISTPIVYYVIDRDSYVSGVEAEKASLTSQFSHEVWDFYLGNDIDTVINNPDPLKKLVSSAFIILNIGPEAFIKSGTVAIKAIASGMTRTERFLELTKSLTKYQKAYNLDEIRTGFNLTSDIEKNIMNIFTSEPEKAASLINKVRNLDQLAGNNDYSKFLAVISSGKYGFLTKSMLDNLYEFKDAGNFGKFLRLAATDSNYAYFIQAARTAELAKDIKKQFPGINLAERMFVETDFVLKTGEAGSHDVILLDGSNILKIYDMKAYDLETIGNFRSKISIKRNSIISGIDTTKADGKIINDFVNRANSKEFYIWGNSISAEYENAIKELFYPDVPLRITIATGNVAYKIVLGQLQSIDIKATPATGTYTQPVNVTLASNPTGAKIYYTTNGTDPTTSSTQYSAPINISQTTTLKFFAQDSAGNKSSVVTQIYTINNTGETIIYRDNFENYPIGSYPTNGWYKKFYGQASVSTNPTNATQKSFRLIANNRYNAEEDEVYIQPSDYMSYEASVYLTDKTKGSFIGYTNRSSWGYWYSLIIFGNNGYIQAGGKTLMAYNANQWYKIRVESDFVNKKMKLYINGNLMASDLDPGTKSFSGFMLMNYNYSTSGTSTIYYDDIKISSVKNTDITPPVISANPKTGLYNTTQTVSLTSNEPAKIYYTLDGSTPTANSTLYSSPISVSQTKTLKFIGIDTAGNTSSVQTETYTIDTVAPTVVAVPMGGTYAIAQNVTLTTESGAKIYYTTNGTEPTTSSAQYSSPINISQTTTLKYFAQDLAGNKSNPVTAVYTINLNVEQIVFQDGFENYVINTYPNISWWNMYSGSQAYVTSEKAFSGIKSFKLITSNPSWVRVDAATIIPADRMNYEISVNIVDRTKGSFIGYMNKNTWGTWPSLVIFGNNGYIQAGGRTLMAYNANQWYRVRVESDFVNRKMKVYINGNLLASDLDPGTKTFNAFMLMNYNYTTLGTSIIYYDDLKITKF